MCHSWWESVTFDRLYFVFVEVIVITFVSFKSSRSWHENRQLKTGNIGVKWFKKRSGESMYTVACFTSHFCAGRSCLHPGRSILSCISSLIVTGRSSWMFFIQTVVSVLRETLRWLLLCTLNAVLCVFADPRRPFGGQEETRHDQSSIFGN